MSARSPTARLDVPLLTMPTTPVLPSPRWTGMPQSVSALAIRSAVRRSSKHSSGWAWMSRRSVVMAAASARMDSIKRMVAPATGKPVYAADESPRTPGAGAIGLDADAAVVGEHRQVDEPRRHMAVAAVADDEAAEVEALHRLEAGDQAVAVERAAGAAHAFGEQLGGDIAFHARVVRLVVATGALHSGQVLARQRRGHAERERHHLA